MSDLDEIINVTFAVDSSGITKQNFFVPMIVSHTASFPERIRFYSSLAAVVNDTLACPATTSPEYISASNEFSQTPRPALIAIGRAATAITLAYKVAPRSSAAGSVYSIDVAGTGITSSRATYTPGADLVGSLLPRVSNVLTQAAHGFTTGDGPVQLSNSGGALPTGLVVNTNYWLINVTASTFSFATSKANALALTAVALSGDGSGVQTIIRAQNDVIASYLVQQLNAVVGKNYTAVTAGSLGSLYVTATANTANAWFAFGTVDATLLDTALTNAGDPTADLVAILAASAQWYQVITNYNSPSYALAVSAWVEANQRTYIVDFNDTTDLNTTSTGSSGTGDTINAAGRTRTIWQYHARPQDCLSAALSGRIVALNPGSWTAAFKTLSGPIPNVISDTQRINLKARRGNYYTSRASRAVTLYGMVGSTSYKFFDIVVGLDFIYNDIQTRVFGALAGNDKLGFDDGDIDQIAGAIRGGITTWKSDAYRIISAGTADSTSDPIPTISFPTVANIDATNRSNRNLPNGVLVFRLLGAVQSVAVRAVITF